MVDKLDKNNFNKMKLKSITANIFLEYLLGKNVLD